MPVDYYAMYAKLLQRAGHHGTPPAEAAACREKATEIMQKHLQPDTHNSHSPFTDQTAVTGRDGHPWEPPFGTKLHDEWTDAVNKIRQQQAQRVAEDLAMNQWRWNTEYYDQHGNPKANEADLDETEDKYTYGQYEKGENEE